MLMDLARLKRVREKLGQRNWTVELLHRERRQELRTVNNHLGRKLASTEAKDRSPMAAAFAGADQLLPADVRTPHGTTNASELGQIVETGCADLGRSFDDAQLAAIHSHLRPLPVLLAHDAHVTTEIAPSLAAVPEDRNYACYRYLDLWSSPHIIELAAQDRILDLAQGYLGCTPTLYSFNAFWSLANRTPHKATQVFHRDWEDFRSIAIFTLLTPVEDPLEGAHYYVEQSHDAQKFRWYMYARGASDEVIGHLQSRNDRILVPMAQDWFERTSRRFDGPAGKSFCADSYGLHRALVPRSLPRLLLWFRFGNFFNETAYKMPLAGAERATAQSVLARIPATPRHQYIFRYLIEALSAA
jgi:hypothetical protein